MEMKMTAGYVNYIYKKYKITAEYNSKIIYIIV